LGADYPTRPVRFIVSYPPAAVPTSSRASWLDGCQIGSGNNSLSRTRPARPKWSCERRRTATRAHDRHGDAINATLYPNLNFNFIRDIAPVASIGRTRL
jgi:hypothetical protein